MKLIVVFILFVAACSVWASGEEWVPSIHFDYGTTNDLSPTPPPFHSFNRDPGRFSFEIDLEPYWDELPWYSRQAIALKGLLELEQEGAREKVLERYEELAKVGFISAHEAQDLQEAWSNQKIPLTDLRIYAKAVLAFHEHSPKAPGMFQKLYEDASKGDLRAHALYRMAAFGYDLGFTIEQAEAYERVAKEFPSHSRAEAALIMGARCRLMPVSVGKKSLDKASQDLQTLLRSFPKTRFLWNATNWLGRTKFLGGDPAAARGLYYRVLQKADTEKEKVSAFNSLIYMARREGNSTECFKLLLLRNELLDLRRPLFEPTADIVGYWRAMSHYQRYACLEKLKQDSRLLTHFANVFIFREGYEKLVVQTLRSLANDSRLSKLAPHVLSRAAEACLNMRKFNEAERWGRRALQRKQQPLEVARSHYVLAGVAQRRKNLQTAISEYEQVVALAPGSHLAGGAHENLGPLYEKQRRPWDAIESYYAAKYSHDVAFLLDVKMTKSEIRKHLSFHPKSALRPLVLYSLAIRHLRDNELDEAQRVLSKLTNDQIRGFAFPDGIEYWGWEEKAEYAVDPRTTIQNLKRLNDNVVRARGAEKKAAAQYELASYYYNKRTLLLYNAALWNGSRAKLFSWYWNPAKETVSDQAAVRKHHYQHECLNRARVLCLDILKKYPKSSVVPQAMYRAATAYERLGRMNEWWRSENDTYQFDGRATKLMERLVKRFPTHHLAKSARYYYGVK